MTQCEPEDLVNSYDTGREILRIKITSSSSNNLKKEFIGGIHPYVFY